MFIGGTCMAWCFILTQYQQSCQFPRVGPLKKTRSASWFERKEVYNIWFCPTMNNFPKVFWNCLYYSCYHQHDFWHHWYFSHSKKFYKLRIVLGAWETSYFLCQHIFTANKVLSWGAGLRRIGYCNMASLSSLSL